MLARRSPLTITPAETPRHIALSLAENQNAVQSAAQGPAIVGDAAALAENASAKELAMRLKLLQRVFR
jgi:hypothetical protein